MPRHSLANDLWMGRQLPDLRQFAAGTKRLLPMIRACLQVAVLQPANLRKEERQRGFIGNSIFLPQAQPSAIRSTLPPPEEDMQESILFVLVGQKKESLAGSALLSRPREEYNAAVSCLQHTSPYYRSVVLRHDVDDPLQGCVLETAEDSYLARELLQKGPADAQGQEEDSEVDGPVDDRAHSGADDAEPGEVHYSPNDGAFIEYCGHHVVEKNDCVLFSGGRQESSWRGRMFPKRRLVLVCGGMTEFLEFWSGNLMSTIIGLNDGADEQNKWVRVVRDLEELCAARPGARRSDAEELVRNRARNDMGLDSSGGGGGGLLGREGAHEKRTMQKIQRVQNLARGTAESERVAEANMFHVRPSKLVVPSGPEPASMFDPATWGMAFPDLFPWADGVPFLRREAALDASEVFRYLLLREELHYAMPEEEDGVGTPPLPRWSLSETLLPLMYDVNRRLHLMRATKAHVQRRGFGKHCTVIASVSVEHLLKAMALHGESADIRKLLQDDSVDLPLQRALGGVLQATSSIIGMEGHRSQIRFRSHAAGWH